MWGQDSRGKFTGKTREQRVGGRIVGELDGEDRKA